MFQPDTDEVIEATRLERLRTLRQASTAAAMPDAAHSVSVLMKAVDDHLAGHPAIAANPALYRLAYRAFENLFSLHEALGGSAHDPRQGRTQSP